jgi:hypothetical protein
MFLKELESWLKRGQNVPFLREICPQKKYTPNIGANIGAITGILLKKQVLAGTSQEMVAQNIGNWGGKGPGKTTHIGNCQPKSY